MCAFVKASADIPSSEGDLKGPEAGYILLTSAATSRIGKDALIAPAHLYWGYMDKSYQLELRGVCSIWMSVLDTQANLDNSLFAPV